MAVHPQQASVGPCLAAHGPIRPPAPSPPPPPPPPASSPHLDQAALGGRVQLGAGQQLATLGRWPLAQQGRRTLAAVHEILLPMGRGSGRRRSRWVRRSGKCVNVLSSAVLHAEHACLSVGRPGMPPGPEHPRQRRRHNPRQPTVGPSPAETPALCARTGWPGQGPALLLMSALDVRPAHARAARLRTRPAPPSPAGAGGAGLRWLRGSKMLPCGRSGCRPQLDGQFPTSATSQSSASQSQAGPADRRRPAEHPPRLRAQVPGCRRRGLRRALPRRGAPTPAAPRLAAAQSCGAGREECTQVRNPRQRQLGLAGRFPHLPQRAHLAAWL